MSVHLECFLTFHCSLQVTVLWAALPLEVTLRTAARSLLLLESFRGNFKIIAEIGSYLNWTGTFWGHLLKNLNYLVMWLCFHLSKCVIGLFKLTAGLSKIKKIPQKAQVLTHISDFKFVCFWWKDKNANEQIAGLIAFSWSSNPAGKCSVKKAQLESFHFVQQTAGFRLIVFLCYLLRSRRWYWVGPLLPSEPSVKFGRKKTPGLKEEQRGARFLP